MAQSSCDGKDSLKESQIQHSDSRAEAGQGPDIVVNGDYLLRVLRGGSAWLDRHVPSVNALNVFPVPDGDTGTNMSLTMHAAMDEAGDRSYDSVSEIVHLVAHGALMGARGNSGVILSQILRGFARALDGQEILTASDLARAFDEGVATAYKGVMKPVEGTILTVIREAAVAANHAATAGASVEQVLASAVTEAHASVVRTPTLLAVLAEAGVVDAGGRGLAIILDGMLRYMRGESLDVVPQVQAEAQHVHPPAGDYNYDTQFVIKGIALDLEAIRQEIATMGDSVLVVGDSETVKVHVHSDHPGTALDFGISQGHVTAVIIENMQLQHEEFVRLQSSGAVGPHHDPDRQIAPGSTSETRQSRAWEQVSSSEVSFSVPVVSSVSGHLSDTAIVAVVAGEGLRRVFESLEVAAIVSGGQTMNPSTQDLLTAIDGVSCDKIILLPNNSNILLAAQQAKELVSQRTGVSSKEVVIVPTRTVPQGISALLAFNYQADLQTNLELMSEASEQVQTVEITKAVRSVQVNGLPIAEGQIIGLINGDLTTAGEDVVSVARELLSRINVAQYEIVTIYHGEDISTAEAASLAESIGQCYPDIEVELLDGGQAHYYYIISAE